MKILIWTFLLLTNITIAQSNEKILFNTTYISIVGTICEETPEGYGSCAGQDIYLLLKFKETEVYITQKNVCSCGDEYIENEFNYKWKLEKNNEIKIFSEPKEIKNTSLENLKLILEDKIIYGYKNSQKNIIEKYTFLNESNEKFLTDFLSENELQPENVLDNYNHFNFSNIWTQIENNGVLGIIGKEHQRIQIKLISILKNKSGPNEYLVSGKSRVKGTICDFSGIITLTEIKEVKKLHFGVDDEYADKGIKSQGILIADYEFHENSEQKHSGIFKGKLYSKWYLNSKNQIEYDNIKLLSDGYTNNAFVGIWKSHTTKKEKICNWADYSVPNANQDFDIGAGEFSPNEKYWDKGWENYSKAFVFGGKKSKKEELKKWWK